MLSSLVYQESCNEHRVSNLLEFWTAMVHCKIITPSPLSLSWKKNVGIISFLLKHMALTTFNGKQRHEIITKCRPLWHRLKWKKNGMQIVNKPISFLSDPHATAHLSAILRETLGKINQP